MKLRMQSFSVAPCLVLLVLVFYVGKAFAQEKAEAPPSTRQAEAIKASGDATGFIYGKVTTRNGKTYRGLIRWGKEEAFWGDLFNSNKDEDQWEKFERRSERRHPIRIFGHEIFVRGGNWGTSHVFAARFGDIAKIKVGGRSDADVVMKSGTTYAVDGGSNDIGADIVVHDLELGTVELPWRKIETVEFLPTPATARPYASRIYGKVKTDAGTFEGFIQWDQEECLSTDKLDGETDDGNVHLDMGKIRSIEKRGSSRSRVELVDGRTLVVSGSNDVNDENRGIYVEDERFGRVSVSWDAFERVDFVTPPNSGPAFDSYRSKGSLQGIVTDDSNKTYSGRLVYDLDEAEGWEVLQGNYRDVEYLIPFDKIIAVEPGNRHGSRVILRGGIELTLEDSGDVSESNGGMIIFKDSEREPRFIPWDEVTKVEFK